MSQRRVGGHSRVRPTTSQPTVDSTFEQLVGQWGDDTPRVEPKGSPEQLEAALQTFEDVTKLVITLGDHLKEIDPDGELNANLHSLVNEQLKPMGEFLVKQQSLQKQGQPLDGESIEQSRDVFAKIIQRISVEVANQKQTLDSYEQTLDHHGDRLGAVEEVLCLEDGRSQRLTGLENSVSNLGTHVHEVQRTLYGTRPQPAANGQPEVPGTPGLVQATNGLTRRVGSMSDTQQYHGQQLGEHAQQLDLQSAEITHQAMRLQAIENRPDPKVVPHPNNMKPKKIAIISGVTFALVWLVTSLVTSNVGPSAVISLVVALLVGGLLFMALGNRIEIESPPRIIPQRPTPPADADGGQHRQTY